MKFDLHTHHFRCGHADDTIEAYIKAAIHAGLGVIGISDHSPYFASEQDQPKPGIAMARSEFANYVHEVLKLKAKYEGTIDVLLGVESDFFPQHAELYRDIYANYPFDYIIGSVHHTREVSIFNRTRWKGMKPDKQVVEKSHYYELIGQSAKSGIFQVLGHIDAMKGYYPAFADIPAEAAIDEALRMIASSGVAIEINTSAKLKDAAEWYPSDAILERALHFGVQVTFGSDSHVPSRVGDEWDAVAQRLREIGFKHWVYFKQKQPVVVPL